MKINNILKICVGIGILSAYIITIPTEVNGADQRLYQDAVALQEKADQIGFSDFHIQDYPVAFYDGSNDYVLQGDKEPLRRKPVLNVLVATAFQVEDHMEVIVPTYDDLNLIINLVVPDVEGMDIEEWKYAMCMSTIWHEATHAWQFSKFDDRINAWTNNLDIDFTRLDENSDVRAVYEKQLKLLQQAATENNQDALKKLANEICDLETKLDEYISEDIRKAETLTELTEGTAQYVESQILKSLCAEEVFMVQYVDNMSVYQDGRDKYYTLGMAKCLLLDKLNPEWKNDYTFEYSLGEMLKKCLS